MALHSIRAVILAIWYLIVPPESSLAPNRDYPAKAPLAKWHVVGTVNSQKECDAQNKRFAFSLTQEPNVAVLINTPKNLTRCISQDEAQRAGLLRPPAIRGRWN